MSIGAPYLYATQRIDHMFNLWQENANPYISRTCSVSASSISTLRHASVSTMRARTLKGVLSSLSTYSISREPDWLRWMPSKHCRVFFNMVGCKGGEDSVSKAENGWQKESKKGGEEEGQWKLKLHQWWYTGKKRLTLADLHEMKREDEGGTEEKKQNIFRT